MFVDNTGSEDFEIGVGEFMAISALYAQSASVDPQDTQVNGLMFAWLLFDRDQEGKLSTVWLLTNLSDFMKKQFSPATWHALKFT